MTSLQCILLTLLVFGTSVCKSYRILAIFPFEMRSHRGVLEPIVEELALKGHQVDLVSTFEVTSSLPNYKNIIKLPVSKKIPSMHYEVITSASKDNEWLHIVNGRMCDLLGHPELSKIIKNPPTNPPYDLIIVHILVGYQCLTAIGHVWNVPVVGVVTTMLYPQMHHYIDNPKNLAISSSNLNSYKEEMNFWERLYNFVMTYRYIYNFYKEHATPQDIYIRKYLGDNMPGYQELEKSIALILSNSHYSYHGVKPKSPALIEIGGINVKNDSSEINLDLKRILDESKDGFIYFSFGSIVVIESLPHEVLERFYTAIRKIAPIRVIMKAPHPEAMPKNMPENVFTFSWLPQQKVLGHPNIKGFVTHGGALGTQEAIFYKVPMICVPFFAEQYVNCDISTLRNIALKIDIRTAKTEDYEHAFTQLLVNPIYKKSAEKLSAQFWDRPQSPREAAVYWIEYVIRHGKNVLKSPAAKLKWWQIELLDIYAFLLACIFMILAATVFISRLILRLIVGRLSTMKEPQYKSLRRLSKKIN